jgi:hypothetical protein
LRTVENGGKIFENGGNGGKILRTVEMVKNF